jgi:hypothetical protein
VNIFLASYILEQGVEELETLQMVGEEVEMT